MTEAEIDYINTLTESTGFAVADFTRGRCWTEISDEGVKFDGDKKAADIMMGTMKLFNREEGAISVPDFNEGMKYLGWDIFAEEEEKSVKFGGANYFELIRLLHKFGLVGNVKEYAELLRDLTTKEEE